VRLDFEWMAADLAALGTDVPTHRLQRGEVEGRRRYDRSAERAQRSGIVRAPQPEPEPLGAHGDTDAYFSGMLEAAGVPREIVPRVLERFAARHREVGLWAHPMEGARATLDAVRALGLRAAVVSNSDGRAEQTLADCGVRDGLEFVVDSHRVGFEKPNPRIFTIALQRMNVRPERALYVGDIVCVDVRGARAAGMEIVLIDPYRDYAPPGVATIPHVGALADWLLEHAEFSTPAARPPILEGAPS